MVLEDLVQVLQHASFLAAVLAGFSVTLFATLMTISPDRRIVAYASGAALLAAAFLGMATIAGIAGVVGAILEPESALGPAQHSTVVGAFEWTTYSFVLGMLAFFTSLGITGWVRSRRFGLFSTIVAAGTIIFLAYFLVAVVQGF